MPEPASHDFGEYRDYLMVLARSQISVDLRGPIDPSDVVQETIYRAICAPPQHREPAQTIAWLRRMLHDKLVDRFRRLRLERRIVSLDGLLDRTSAGMSVLLEAHQPTPESVAIREENAQALATVLSQLVPSQAEAIVLKHCRGMKVEEISRHMNRTPDAVGGLLRHGMRALREIMPRED